MPRTVSIGYQEFDDIINNHIFYVDKTNFIKEWWEGKDRVTLITRPRRFGKTLCMSMVEQFFSVEHANSDLFHDLRIWNDENYRKLQGTYPVISLSFSDIKENSYKQVRNKICESIVDLYNHYDFLAAGDLLNRREKEYFYKVSASMEDSEASIALKRLSGYLYKYYNKKVIILLDEYDTPMLEAYSGGYWEELVAFTRSLFNATFKNNPYLERAILTGITRISKESIFSDVVVTILRLSPQHLRNMPIASALQKRRFLPPWMNMGIPNKKLTSGPGMMDLLSVMLRISITRGPSLIFWTQGNCSRIG